MLFIQHNAKNFIINKIIQVLIFKPKNKWEKIKTKR